MATDAISNIKNAFAAETSSKRLNELEDLPQICANVEYAEESNYLVDATTESHVETDDVNVTVEIYSMTDLPSQLQPEEFDTQQAPGSLNPEFLDGKCVILCSYRCKGVDTSDLPVVPESVPALDDNTHDPLDESEELSETVECGQYPCVQSSLITITIGGPVCKDSCPNLIITEGSQTDETICGRPDDQGDFAGITTTAVSVTEGDKELKASSQTGLTTIEELEEAPEKEGEPTKEGEPAKKRMPAKEKKEAKVSTDATQEVAAGPSEAFIDADSRKELKAIYDVGTIIQTPSSTWLERPRRRKDCRMICTRVGSVQCEIMRNDLCTSRCYSMNYWACKSRRSCSFMRYQSCGINNTNACNPYYLNCHNSIGRYYSCNNRYNAASCCAIGNRTIHCAPSRCHYYVNSWC